jgi:hypothetical protein
MLKSKNIFSIVLLLLLISSNSWAKDWSTSVTAAKAVGQFPIGIGSEVTVVSPDEKVNGPAVFLGSTVLPGGEKSFQLYLNKKSKNLFYLPEDLFASVKPTQQTVLDSYQQAGGTCSAYAINNFLGQTNLSGFEGTGELKNLLTTEEGRTFQLADAINEYYLTLSHKYSLRGILNKYGKSYGFKCKMLANDTYEKVRSNILDHLDSGLPVIVSFNIGPDMVKGPFKLEAYEQKGPKLDDRLWIPRRVGERNNGGHTIVAVGSFELNQKTYLVMIDSDWSEPRVWDMDLYLNHKKTALDEIEFVSCK